MELEDTNPKLALQTNDLIGRLYHKPGFILPEEIQQEKISQFTEQNKRIPKNIVDLIKELIITGDLMPSTTNIIGVRSSPYLIPWASRLVASEMVEMALKNPKFMERVRKNKYGAIDHFKNAPIRERDFWGNQGSKIHLVCDMLARGKDVSHIELTPYEKASVDAWKAWVDIMQPDFKHIEVTGFGETSNGKKYGKTTDFIATIGGKTVIGDYKCVTDNTPILLPSGATKPAIEVKAGDKVVAWTKEKGLHTATVSYAGDNGHHKTVNIRTTDGQTIQTTLNHPFWSSRQAKNLGWVNGEDLRVGDELYISQGWNYAPEREELEWPYRKNLSPYLFGLLWTLRNFSKQNLREEHLINLPPISRAGLREELREIGFIFNKKGQLNTRKGFAKIAKKNKMEVDDLLNLIDTPKLPDYVYGADRNHITAFITGIREVFANKEIYEEELMMVMNVEALKNLQQFFLNLGQPATIKQDAKSGISYMKTPFESKETVYAYGPTATRVASIEIIEQPEHTVAIEVEGSHTHITAGLITHNTNRSGLHIDVALQLAANARVSELTDDNETLVPAPKIDTALGVHISPDGVSTKEVNIGDSVYEVFESLRNAWDFHAFEGELTSSNGVYKKVVKTPKDL